VRLPPFPLLVPEPTEIHRGPQLTLDALVAWLAAQAGRLRRASDLNDVFRARGRRSARTRSLRFRPWRRRQRRSPAVAELAPGLQTRATARAHDAERRTVCRMRDRIARPRDCLPGSGDTSWRGLGSRLRASREPRRATAPSAPRMAGGGAPRHQARPTRGDR